MVNKSFIDPEYMMLLNVMGHPHSPFFIAASAVCWALFAVDDMTMSGISFF